MQTREGAGVGSIVSEVRDAYQERLRATQYGTLWEFRADADSTDALTFLAEDGDDSDKVFEVSAGGECTFR